MKKKSEFLYENFKFLVVKFSVYLNNVGTHKKRLGEVLLLSTHNLCFCGELRKIL